MLEYVGEGIFWFFLLNLTIRFATVGATAAALKHLFAPEASLKELTPVALTGPNKLHPGSLWWGGYAFSIMNAGFASIGYYAAWTSSNHAKKGFLLGTAVLFCSFALAWFQVGSITGNKKYKYQGAKILVLGGVFLTGFFLKIS